MSNNLASLKKELIKISTPKKAKASAQFLKTAPGQYGHGDIFIGVTVPEQRKIAQKHLHLTLEEINQLLNSKEHEFRLTALFVLTYQYENAVKNKDLKTQEKIYKLYLNNTKNINNWDLVDCSAGYIVGSWLHDKSNKMEVLTQLANSKNLWEKRIAIISTFYYIRQNQAEPTFKIAQILLNDDHDLIHKAVGWMLREVGKRCSEATEEKFLKKYYKKMPRTMLRYAIERFAENKRISYLKNLI